MKRSWNRSPIRLRSIRAFRNKQEGRWGYILAWLIGVSVPILILSYLLRGCT